MGRPRKADPAKSCEFCKVKLARTRFNGRLEDLTAFLKRKYCSRKCRDAAQDAKPSKSVLSSTTHHHARKLCEQGVCTVCLSAPGVDVHHKDGDHTNNMIENLTRVCRSCHLKLHRSRKAA